MALRLNRSSSQYIYSALSGISARYPLTLMAWYKRQDTSTYATETVVSIGDVDVADWESRDANGNLVLYNGVRELNTAWNPGDNGHLNAAGANWVASKLYNHLFGII